MAWSLLVVLHIVERLIDAPASLVVLSGFASIAIVSIIHRRRKQASLPLGPPPRFLTGNLHEIPRSESWRTYAEWANQYGPIFLFRVFSKKIVVLSSHSAVVDLLESRSSNYSEWPIMWIYKELIGRKLAVFNISASHPRFKVYRKLLHTALDTQAVRKLCLLQERETKRLLRSLHGRPDAFITHFRRNAGTVIIETSYGWTVNSDGDYFVNLMEEGFKVQAEVARPGRWLVDMFPFLCFLPSWFPGAGFKHKAAKYREEFSRVDRIPHDWAMEQIWSGTHIESFTSLNMRPGDGTMPDAETEDIIRWCSSALYSGGTDTIVAVMTLFILVMTLNPDAQHRAQEEIDRVVGTDRLPTVDDCSKLPYVDVLIKEILRWAPAAPLGLPHAALRDDYYQGYLIPKECTVVANIWALMHDPSTYSDPFSFDPTRFLEDEGSGMQHDPSCYIFGFGRCICPGQLFFLKRGWEERPNMYPRCSLCDRVSIPGHS
ncbi:cytochrome P450 [Vararia minispora EC-137]|uniref:Cytochrome P450 n=1 Tax=Vararia minispora EC-137 TaxID=1314806 RepID=A0ACB8Q430_9AGAM|nr:cytochrome P450 [Vararia minispora EC-137]